MRAVQNTSDGECLTHTTNATQNKTGWMQYEVRAAMNKRTVWLAIFTTVLTKNLLPTFVRNFRTSSESLVRKVTTQHGGIMSPKSAIFNKLINFAGLSLLERMNFL
jgi:hypothetical protein